jgi:hypothetical protein
MQQLATNVESASNHDASISAGWILLASQSLLAACELSVDGPSCRSAGVERLCSDLDLSPEDRKATPPVVSFDLRLASSSAARKGVQQLHVFHLHCQHNA